MSQVQPLALGERYRVEGLLGQGGMGSVYRAYDRLTGKQVALKLVPVEADLDERSSGRSASLGDAATMVLSLEGVAGESDATQAGLAQSLFEHTVAAKLQSLRLQTAGSVRVSVGPPKSSTNAMWARLALAQEFRTLASLRHPHIISVLDYGFVGRRQPFFTMELLQGAQTLTAASQSLPQPEKVALLLQLLRALSYLHRRGILHRDLKPANVLVVRDGDEQKVKLLDFGLSLVRSHTQPKGGEISGTLAYMAPELFLGQPASEAGDLFAVGVIAYELLCGRYPFENQADGELMAAIARREPSWEGLRDQPAVLALLQRLLAKAPSLRPSVDETLSLLSRAAGVPAAAESVALRESALQSARLVGREESLSRLRGALSLAQTGSGSLYLLGGESGVGKSRLMEELRVHALVQGVYAVRGQAISEGGGAFSVWQSILRALCLRGELDELEASVLKVIVPDLERLLERPIADAPELHAQAAQLRLMSVIESLLLRQRDPLLLLLEDVHWADAESLSLLRRVALACQSRPLLILASYRDDESPSLPQEFPGSPVMKLERLKTADIGELCRAMVGPQAATPELVSFLSQETEGNVLFIIEVTRALAEEAGALSQIMEHGLPKHVLTGGIRAIVQRRLARLPQSALPLLQLAAVAGRQLDLDLLRRFEPQLEAWLYLSADAAVLEASDRSWRFAHDKIRESLLVELDTARRRALHLAVAEAMEGLYAGSAAHAAALAEHYQRAGEIGKAALYQVEAGMFALAQGATEQATALLLSALSDEGRALLPAEVAARAYGGLIQAQAALGQFPTCIAVFEQFMGQIGLPMPNGYAAILRSLSAISARQLRGHRKSLSEERATVLREVAQAARWAAETYVWVGRPLQSIATALHGAELAYELDEPGLLAHYLAGFSYLTGLIPLHPGSETFLSAAARSLKKHPTTRGALDFGRIASVRYLNAARWDLALRQMEPLIALSREVGDEQSLMFGLSFSFIIGFRLDDETLYRSRGPELFERAQRNQSSQFARTYPLYEGLRALRAGDLSSAARWLGESERFVQRSQDVVGKILVGGVLALYELKRGERRLALARAEAVLEVGEATRLSNDVVGEGIAAVVDVYLTLQELADPAEPRAYVEPLRRALRLLRRCAQIFPGILPRALVFHGRAAQNYGALQLAQRLLSLGLRQAERLRMPYDIELARGLQSHYFATLPKPPADWNAELRAVSALLRDIL